MKVLFFHHKYIAGHEVDFVIPRPGRRGLVVEVDGDMFHLDERRKAERDKVLKAAGWDVLHIWSSEVVQLPTAVQRNLEQALEGVPRIKKRNKRKSTR